MYGVHNIFFYLVRYVVNTQKLDHVFKEREDVMLCKVSKTKEAVIKEIDKFKKAELPVPNDPFQSSKRSLRYLFSTSWTAFFESLPTPKYWPNDKKSQCCKKKKKELPHYRPIKVIQVVVQVFKHS